MNSMRVDSRVNLGVTFLLCTVVIQASAQSAGPPRGKPIEFSSPGSSESSTNLSRLNELDQKQERLRKFEAEILGNSRTFSPDSSLGGVSAPIIRPITRNAIPTKKRSDLSDQGPGWLLMTPGEFLGTPDADDSSRSSSDDGKDSRDKDKQSLTPDELYFLELTGQTGSLANNDRRKDGSSRDQNLHKNQDSTDADNGSDGDPESSSTFKSEQRLKALLGVAGSSPDNADGASTSVHDQFTDFFGLSRKSASLNEAMDRKLANEAYMQAFRKLSTFSDSMTTVPGLSNPLRDPSRSAFLPLAGLSGLYSSGPALGDGQASQLKDLAPRAALPSPELNAFTPPGAGQVLPKVEPKQSFAPPPPTFTAPRRF